MSYYVLIPGNKIDKPKLLSYNGEDCPENNYIQINSLIHNLKHEHIIKVYVKCPYEIYKNMCNNALNHIDNLKYRIDISKINYDIVVYHKYYNGIECDGMTEECCNRIIDEYLSLSTN